MLILLLKNGTGTKLVAVDVSARLSYKGPLYKKRPPPVVGQGAAVDRPAMNY